MSFSSPQPSMPANKLQPLTEKLDLLAESFKPILFVPNDETLEFSTHEKLLKHLGLWDFVHVFEFESSLRTDHLAQLIVTYDAQKRCSYVNDTRISVSRDDLARALKLPLPRKRDNKVNHVVDLEAHAEIVSEESIALVEAFVFNWVLLHEDMWMMPNEVLNWTRMIREGHPENVEWASLMWFMVEKELVQGSRLGHCYYASHLQCLIKSQLDEAVFSEGPIVDITVKEDKEGDDVKMDDGSRDVEMSNDGNNRAHELERPNIEFGLGQYHFGKEQVVQDDVKMSIDGGSYGGHELEEPNFELSLGQYRFGKEQLVKDDVKMSIDGGSYGGHELEEPNFELSLGQYRFGKEQLVKDDVKMSKDGTHGSHGDHELERPNIIELGLEQYNFGKEQIVQDDMKSSYNGGHELEEPNIELSLGLHNFFAKKQVVQDDVIDFKDCKEQEPGQRLLNDKNNAGEHFLQRCAEDNPVSGGLKRLRSDEHLKQNSLDFDLCIKNVDHWMGKAKHLSKDRLAKQQKEETDIRWLEHERDCKIKLLQGYKNGIKETSRALSEYRARCLLPGEEPLCKDVAGKQRRPKQADQEKIKCRKEIEVIIKEFEAKWTDKFEAHLNKADKLNSKLMDIQKGVKPLKEIFSGREVLPGADSPPNE